MLLKSLRTSQAQPEAMVTMDALMLYFSPFPLSNEMGRFSVIRRFNYKETDVTKPVT